MSVRTAWEIAALEDVRLAPSPRQQQPAPARVCGGLCLTPPGPSLGPRRCRQGRGTPQRGAHPLSARLFCSWSALPAPLVGHKWAGAWVSLVLGPTPGPGEPPGKSWGACPTGELGWVRCGSCPFCLSPTKLRRRFLLLGLETPLEEGRGRSGPRAPHPGPVLWAGLLDEARRSLRPEPCWWGEGRTPWGQTSGRRALGLRPGPTPPAAGAGPGPATPSSGSVSPLLPSAPAPPPSPLPHRCLVARPRTQRLLAIQGEVPRAWPSGSGGQLGPVLAALGLGCEFSGQEPYLVQKL